MTPEASLQPVMAMNPRSNHGKIRVGLYRNLGRDSQKTDEAVWTEKTSISSLFSLDIAASPGP